MQVYSVHTYTNNTHHTACVALSARPAHPSQSIISRTRHDSSSPPRCAACRLLHRHRGREADSENQLSDIHTNEGEGRAQRFVVDYSPSSIPFLHRSLSPRIVCCSIQRTVTSSHGRVSDLRTPPQSTPGGDWGHVARTPPVVHNSHAHARVETLRVHVLPATTNDHVCVSALKKCATITVPVLSPGCGDAQIKRHRDMGNWDPT